MSVRRLIGKGFIAASLAVQCGSGMPAETVKPAQRDAQCLAALRHEAAGALDDEATAYFKERVSKERDPEVAELLMLSANEAILTNANRREIAFTCVLLYQVLSLQERTADPDGGPGASPGRERAAPGEQPAWRVVALPEGGELRYIPPLPTGAEYPAEDKAARREGTTMTRLTINPAGQVARCEIARSAGSAALDASACRLYVDRARFELRNVSQAVEMLAPVVWKLEE